MKAVVEDFHRTGSIAPSSRYLARAMLRHLPRTEPIRVLEVGAGAGVFTDALVARLAPGSHLDVVEINGELADLVRTGLRTLPAIESGQIDFEVHHTDVREFQVDHRYRAIVCGLPFNNFPANLVEELLADFLARLQPGGTLSFFEYVGVRGVLKHGLGACGDRLRRVDAVMQRYRRDHLLAEETVVRNLPPARAVHLVAPAEQAPAPGVVQATT
jgi:phospholipid N-methyltransferase